MWLYKGNYMIYRDEKLKRRELDPQSPFYKDRKRLQDLGHTYIPDENLPFYTNLMEKYKFDLRIQCLKEIIEIKRKFYLETGEMLCD